MTSFPTSPEMMTSDWLARALGQPIGALQHFTAKPIGTGQMCESYRLTLQWQVGISGPATIVAKCPAQDEASRHVAALTGTYIKEVSWYRDLAEGSGVAAPHCYFADIAENEVDFILLISDLAPAAQGDQLSGRSLAELRPTIDAAAALHALRWNSPELENFSWLVRDNRPILRNLFPQFYTGFRERYQDRLSADVLNIGAGIVERLEDYLAREPTAPTLIHGDLRIDNILFSPDSAQSWLVDWQTLAKGSGATDIAYLIGTSIADPQERAAADQPAFQHWISALRRHAVDVDEAALWTEYRIGALSGYFMAVFASMSVARTERGDEMFAVMAERPALQAMALGSLDLI
ncbi:MAG TPA: phosphotransferase [Sphingopyxis sp.]|nr:phosphotransferase [Sphingopyxis sp.]